MNALPAGIERVAVIVPAHDEETLVPACLRAIRTAAAGAAVPVEVFFVADNCRDATERVLREAAGTRAGMLTVVPVRLSNVGAARAAGVRAAIGRNGPGGLWLLNTDADTLVPPDWINRHLAHAGRGADLVTGTVRAVDWSGWTPALARRYRRRYAEGVHRSGHGHIHGANLGIRAQTYLDLGGFAPLPTGEDVALVGAARAAGAQMVSAIDLAVRTSTRRIARAPAGFSGHLHALARPQPDRLAVDLLPAAGDQIPDARAT